MYMKKILLVFVAMNCLFFSCSKDPKSPVPACIQQRIIELQNKPVQNPPVVITEYLYSGKKVYLISADCCDQYDILVDEKCNTVCAPSGGFTGKGDGKCEDFEKTATLIKVIWKDDRKK